MQKLIRSTFIAAFTLTTTFFGYAKSEPVNVPHEFIDRSNSYDNNVNLIRSLVRRGALTSSLASSQMFVTLDQALSAVRTSRLGPTLQTRTIAKELEDSWIWWTESGAVPKGGEPIETQMLIHNRTDEAVKGVVIELSDRGCDFRATAPKAYIVMSFSASDILRPNDLAVYRTAFPTTKSMFLTAGGSWCATIVRSF